MKQIPSIVTDHALVRYLERVYGVDMDGLRRRIEKITEEGRDMGAAAVNCDGVSYTLSSNGRVITVNGTQGRKFSNRAERWKARRS